MLSWVQVSTSLATRLFYRMFPVMSFRTLLIDEMRSLFSNSLLGRTRFDQTGAGDLGRGGRCFALLLLTRLHTSCRRDNENSEVTPTYVYIPSLGPCHEASATVAHLEEMRTVIFVPRASFIHPSNSSNVVHPPTHECVARHAALI